MPGNQKPPFLATNLAAGNTCNALLALVVAGWILGQLKWDHMMITGLVVAILLGLNAYRYIYARRHPHRGRRRTVARVSRTGSVSVSAGLASVPPVDTGLGGSIRGGNYQGSGISGSAKEEEPPPPPRRYQKKLLALNLNARPPQPERMLWSDALRQALGVPEREDTTV